MKSRSPLVVATLFEGEYELGARALINSLIEAGFRGHLYCGVKGSPPRWSADLSGIEVNFVALDTEMHLTHYKPTFLLDVLDRSETAEGVVYFDPDIVVRCPFDFIESWVAGSVAAAADVNWLMPRSSPVRHRWVELCRELGVPEIEKAGQSTIDLYCNAGFMGIHASARGFLETWKAITAALMEWGARSDALYVDERSAVIAALDQDTFNISMMIWSERASLMGPEAMDFAPGGQVLSHAVGVPKPWQKRFLISALTGRPPTKRDLAFLQYSAGPLPVWAPMEQRRRIVTYKLGRAIGGIWRRSDY